jgi:hypothetical protein
MLLSNRIAVPARKSRRLIAMVKPAASRFNECAAAV